MKIKLLTKQYLEFLSLKGDYTGSSESAHGILLEISCRGLNISVQRNAVEKILLSCRPKVTVR